jgi:hypothetical protein
VRGSETSSLPVLCLIYFIFARNSMPLFLKSNEKAKKLRVSPTLEVVLKIITDFEAGK